MAEPFREPFPVVDSSAWPLAYSEPVGNEQKDWHRDPDGHLWLFKPRTEHEGWAQGEDWAEKIVAQVVHLSELERTFTLELLAVNLRRLNDAL